MIYSNHYLLQGSGWGKKPCYVVFLYNRPDVNMIYKLKLKYSVILAVFYQRKYTFNNENSHLQIPQS